MRVKVTVHYGDDDKSMSSETEEYQILPEDEDPESYDEALDHLTDSVIEPYQSDGYDFEDDEEEVSIGTDYLASLILYEPFNDKAEAEAFLDQIIRDCDQALADLE